MPRSLVLTAPGLYIGLKLSYFFSPVMTGKPESLSTVSGKRRDGEPGSGLNYKGG